LQYLPYVISALVSLLLAWTYLRVAFPNLAGLLPLKFDLRLVVSLLERSFWVYLCSLGNLIYVTTDRLVVQAWFGPEHVPRYQFNYKVCELAVFVIINASFVALPKITEWLATPGPEAKKRVHDSVRRLTQFQALLGCAAAVIYLAINDFFMTHWLGPDMRAPLLWQAAFALNLAVTTSGEAGVEVSTRCGGNGMRVAGLLIATTGLLNLGLSVISAKLGWIAGIGLATVIAQSLLSLGLGWYVCRHLNMRWTPWILRTWLAPVLVVCLAAVGRKVLPFNSLGNVFLLAIGYASLLAAMAWALGINSALIREEWAVIRAILRRRAP
jgi:O-antigen/teichoic acid export membrane protein